MEPVSRSSRKDHAGHLGNYQDAIVVGSGPNGLAAAITLARQGLSTLVIEASETIGGGTRTAALTLPGFLHDVCSAVHPFAVASPARACRSWSSRPPKPSAGGRGPRR